jgi:hypothetical protein
MALEPPDQFRRDVLRVSGTSAVTHGEQSTAALEALDDPTGHPPQQIHLCFQGGNDPEVFGNLTDHLLRHGRRLRGCDR